MPASLAPFVLRRPWLTKLLTPAASWYANAAGYRKLGLRYEFDFFPPTDRDRPRQPTATQQCLQMAYTVLDLPN